jgi:hypothetical protein
MRSGCVFARGGLADVRGGETIPMSDLDKPIGRRVFIGLIVGGVAALFLGKDLFASLFGRSKRAVGTEGFRINSIASGPSFDESTWRLSVEGLVRKPLDLTFTELLALPQVEPVRDFDCEEHARRGERD